MRHEVTKEEYEIIKKYIVEDGDGSIDIVYEDKTICMLVEDAYEIGGD